MHIEYVYIGRDNVIDLQLQDDSSGSMTNTDLSTATKVGVALDATTEYDSDANPDQVSFSSSGVVSLELGTLIDADGRYIAEIIVYDSDHPNGIAWQPRFMIHALESE